MSEKKSDGSVDKSRDIHIPTERPLLGSRDAPLGTEPRPKPPTKKDDL